MKKIKMTFEVSVKFKDIIDEQTFREEYNGDVHKLCKFMVKNEGIQGWYDEELKLVRAEIIN